MASPVYFPNIDASINKSDFITAATQIEKELNKLRKCDQKELQTVKIFGKFQELAALKQKIEDKIEDKIVDNKLNDKLAQDTFLIQKVAEKRVYGKEQHGEGAGIKPYGKSEEQEGLDEWRIVGAGGKDEGVEAPDMDDVSSEEEGEKKAEADVKQNVSLEVTTPDVPVDMEDVPPGALAPPSLVSTPNDVKKDVSERIEALVEDLPKDVKITKITREVADALNKKRDEFFKKYEETETDLFDKYPSLNRLLVPFSEGGDVSAVRNLLSKIQTDLAS